MQRTRTINGVRSRKILRVFGIAVPATVQEISVSVLLVLSFTVVNILSYSSLYASARHNEMLKEQLVALKKENSSLEETKANIVNIKEIQNKAESLGFVHNNSVNYIKQISISTFFLLSLFYIRIIQQKNSIVNKLFIKKFTNNK